MDIEAIAVTCACVPQSCSLCAINGVAVHASAVIDYRHLSDVITHTT